jgi:hypothetical protein
MDISTINRCIEIQIEQRNEALDEIKTIEPGEEYNIYKAVQYVTDTQELIDLLVAKKKALESVNA